jgi:hypothetical protein
MRAFVQSDLAEVNGWRLAHGLAGVALDQLPAAGQIEPDVAAGFLYATDSSIALLDGYITNPAAGLRERSRAVDEITSSLLRAAKAGGARSVVAVCLAGGIARRARRFGLGFRGAARVLSGRL